MSDQEVTLFIQPSLSVLLDVKPQQGPQGIQGPPGLTEPIFNFSFGDAAPALVVSLLAGLRLSIIRLVLDVPFNGTAPRVSLGTLSSANMLIDGDVLPLNEAGTFDFSASAVFAVPTSLYLFITPGAGATTGRGSLSFQRQ